MKTYRKVVTVQAKIFEKGDEDGMIHPMDGNAVMGDRVLNWYTLVPYIKTLDKKRQEGKFGKHYLCVGVNGERWLVEKSIFEKTYVEEGNKAREYHSPLIQELLDEITTEESQRIDESMRFMFIVKYSYGDWDDFSRINIFITDSEKTAKEYVERFNSILNKWKAYWKQFENPDGWYEDDSEKFQRWLTITNTHEAYYDKIQIR